MQLWLGEMRRSSSKCFNWAPLTRIMLNSLITLIASALHAALSVTIVLLNQFWHVLRHCLYVRDTAS
jgi:hypothetical protein